MSSFDLLMGIVGGISALLWTGTGWLLSTYQEFRFNNSIIGMIYPTSPQPDPEAEGPQDVKTAEEMLFDTVKARGKFYYSYWQYYWAWILLKLCCCCVNKKSKRHQRREFQFKRYRDAVKRMNEEVDILKHIANQRTSQFV